MKKIKEQINFPKGAMLATYIVFIDAIIIFALTTAFIINTIL